MGASLTKTVSAKGLRNTLSPYHTKFKFFLESPKGLRKNSFTELAPGFGSDLAVPIVTSQQVLKK
jgi:hypothetical protein